MPHVAVTNLTLALDRRLALDALVLSQVATLPKLLRQSWLHDLVIAGFKLECHTLKHFKQVEQAAGHGRGVDRSHDAYAAWCISNTELSKTPSTICATASVAQEHLEQDAGVAQCKGQPISVSVVGEQNGQKGIEKPFAALSRIIG